MVGVTLGVLVGVTVGVTVGVGLTIVEQQFIPVAVYVEFVAENAVSPL